tara:strand:- start:306 stop:500 length:195 start_codon:yes stop_codon:yes gene_type:complete
MLTVIGVWVSEVERQVEAAARIHAPAGNVIKTLWCLSIPFAKSGAECAGIEMDATIPEQLKLLS